MSLQPARMSLRNWLLVITLPVIGLLSLTYAVVTYRGLNAIILEGFDRKLMAVGSTVAAFVDAEDHARMMHALPLGGLVTDGTGNGLWSVDLATRQLVHIDTATGRAAWEGDPVPGTFTHIAAGATHRELLLSDSGTGRVESLNLTTGAIAAFRSFAPPLHTMASAPEPGWLFVAGRDFDRFNWANGDSTQFEDLPFVPLDLTYDPSRRVLWALDSLGDRLHEIDPDTGVVRRVLRLRFDPEDPSLHTAAHLDVHLTAICYDEYSGTMFATGDSLFRIDPDKALLSAAGLMPAFGREYGPLYQRYVAALRNLKDYHSIRYLYTQVVRHRTEIVYGLDASLGEEHSNLLSLDELPLELIEPVQEMMINGALVISGVLNWGQWGRLKTAQTPIFDPHTGHVMAMAGADIDIGTIDFDTHRAMVITLGAGALLMLLAGITSLAIVRQLTAPLGVIRNGAMRATAGDYREAVVVERPAELKLLADRFTASTSQLNRLVQSLGQSIARRETGRDHSALSYRLISRGGRAGASGTWTWGPTPRARQTETAPWGAVAHRDTLLAWIAPPLPELAASVNAQRAILAQLAQAALRHHGGDEAVLRDKLGIVAPGTITWLLLETDGGRVLIQGNDSASWSETRLPNGRGSFIAAPPLASDQRINPGCPRSGAELHRELCAQIHPPHFILVNYPA